MDKIIYSTIFKTFDNNLTGIINKIGIFNKSFSTIGRDFSSGNEYLLEIRITTITMPLLTISAYAKNS